MKKLNFHNGKNKMKKSIVLSSPIQALKILISWEKTKNIREDPLIITLTISGFSSQ